MNTFDIQYRFGSWLVAECQGITQVVIREHYTRPNQNTLEHAVKLMEDLIRSERQQ